MALYYYFVTFLLMYVLSAINFSFSTAVAVPNTVYYDASSFLVTFVLVLTHIYVVIFSEMSSLTMYYSQCVIQFPGEFLYFVIDFLFVCLFVSFYCDPGTHFLQDFNSFMFVDICSKAQDMDGLNKCSLGTWKKNVFCYYMKNYN